MSKSIVSIVKGTDVERMMEEVLYNLGGVSSLVVALGLLIVVGIHIHGGPQPWAYFTPLGMGFLLAGLVLAHTHKRRHKIEATA